MARWHQERSGQWVSCLAASFVLQCKAYVLWRYISVFMVLLDCRSTGEFPSMTLAERKHAAELCRAHWPGKVVVGVSSTAVADCLELIEHAATQVTTANKVSKHAEGLLSHQFACICLAPFA